LEKEGVSILKSKGGKNYKNRDPAWNSLRQIWISHKIAKRKNQKIKMLSTALTIINLQRYLKRPVTKFEGVF
jgi:hypothetical protein